LAAPARNLELKVECAAAGLAPVIERAYAAGIGPFTTLYQTDTYFAVPAGRLKLREIQCGGERSAELIAYDRPDATGPRWSEYHRVPVDPAQVEPLIAALLATCGLLTVVRKRREVAISGRTRIHLDDVDGLGAFVELETVLADDDDKPAGDELASMARALGLTALVPVAGSYSDLQLTREGATRA
jgi:adenylate cyclase class IV